jgi:MFS family permease
MQASRPSSETSMSTAAFIPGAAPRLAPGRRAQLSTMMFLQYAVWGAWFAVVGVYLKNGLHFSDDKVGWIVGTMALGTIFAPMFIGQIADRYFSSEKLMAVLHLGGAALLYAMANVKEFPVFFAVALVYALLYSPTLVLSNSITFANVPDGGRDFPRLRVFGTAGWIAANWIVDLALPKNADATNAPILLAAGFSLVLGLFSFALPHTPPPGKSGDAFPALRAVGLLRSPGFAVFFGVSFIITIVLAFYYTFTAIYLTDSTLPAIKAAQTAKPEAGQQTSESGKGAADESNPALAGKNTEIVAGGEEQTKIELTLGNWELKIGPAILMTIGQYAELILLPFLPWFLRKMGMKWVLAMGMAAWGIRYLIFALGAQGSVSPWLVIASLALHGVCFDFFFAAGFIYVDNEAPNEIRASAQGLFTFLTYGLGMWLGNVVSGYVADNYTTHPSGPTSPAVHDWYHIWMIPSIGVLVSLVIFALFFRVERRQAL